MLHVLITLPSLIYRLINTWWRKQTMKLPIKQFSPSFHYILTLGPQYCSAPFFLADYFKLWHIFLFLLFNLFCLCIRYSSMMRDHISHPCKTKGNSMLCFTENFQYNDRTALWVSVPHLKAELVGTDRAPWFHLQKYLVK